MLHRLNFVLLIAVVALAATACGGGSGEKRGETRSIAQSVHADLVAGPVTVESYGPDTTIDADQKATVLALVESYIDSALIHPLEQGTLGEGYGGLFDDGLRTEATTADASALTLTGVGKVERYDETVTPIAISGLADENGGLVYVAAKFTVAIEAPTAGGPGTFGTDAELTYVPAGDTWKINGYRVTSVRAIANDTTTSTTAESGS